MYWCVSIQSVSVYRKWLLILYHQIYLTKKRWDNTEQANSNSTFCDAQPWEISEYRDGYVPCAQQLTRTLYLFKEVLISPEFFSLSFCGEYNNFAWVSWDLCQEGGECLASANLCPASHIWKKWLVISSWKLFSQLPVFFFFWQREKPLEKISLNSPFLPYLK